MRFSKLMVNSILWKKFLLRYVLGAVKLHLAGKQQKKSEKFLHGKSQPVKSINVDVFAYQ
jgi:hypothetical protein